MNYSIKTYSVVSLLLSVCSVVFITIVIHLLIEHENFSEFLDSQLLQTNQLLSSVLNENMTIDEINEINKNFNSDYQQSIHNVEFIIWNRYNIPLIKSPDSPFMTHPFGQYDDYSSVEIDKRYWRIYNTKKADSGTTITSMYQLESRIQLEKNITRNGILVMLMSLPLFALIIWLIVNKSLQSIKRTTQELSDREPNHLDPMSQDNVPTEILPLIKQLNILFIQLRNTLLREKQFAGNAAHELRTPLAAIKMHVHAALHDCHDKQITKSLNKVLQGVDRSQHQINQLLVLSTMIPDALSKELKNVDLKNTITEVIENVINQALNRNIRIQLDYKNKSFIRGYPYAINILFNNLIGNAIKYTKEDSIIIVRVYEQRECVVCEVIDEGPGLSDEQIKHVFERFYRATETSKPGTGLGLNIVKQIIDLQNAEINLYNRDNKAGLIAQVKLKKEI